MLSCCSIYIFTNLFHAFLTICSVPLPLCFPSRQNASWIQKKEDISKAYVPLSPLHKASFQHDDTLMWVRPPFRRVAEKKLKAVFPWKIYDGICAQLQLSATLSLLRQTGASKNVEVMSPSNNPGSHHFCNCQASVSSSWVSQVTMELSLFYLQGSHTFVCTTPSFCQCCFPSQSPWKAGNPPEALGTALMRHLFVSVC